jgi:D-apiose dehydrogenase
MIRVAVIGLGAVTRNIHLPAYRQLGKQVKVVAGCDPDQRARLAVSRSWDVGDLYQDASVMVEKAKPDVVAICTPPSMHRDLTLMAVERGCHVFCEKPMADELSQADDMIRASERSGRLVVVNNQFPEMKIHRAAKDFIGSPEFGRLLYLHASQTFFANENTEVGWRGELQRRVCFEFGIHVFELIRYFFDETPVRVFAHMPQPDPRTRCDAVNVVSVEFEDGRAASMVLDRLSKGPERYLDMRLDGEFGSIETSVGGELQFRAGFHTRERRPFLSFDAAKGGKATLRKGNSSRVIARDGFNPFAAATAAHFQDFINAIQNGATPRCTARDNRQSLSLVFAAYESASRGRAVDTANFATSLPVGPVTAVQSVSAS